MTLEEAIAAYRNIFTKEDTNTCLSLILDAAEKQLEDGPRARRMDVIDWFFKQEWNGNNARNYSLDYVDRHFKEILAAYRASQEGK